MIFVALQLMKKQEAPMRGNESVVVRVADLRIDAPYQGPRLASAEAWAKKMEPDFDESRLGTPEVSFRNDGSIYVVDGVGRTLLLRRVGVEEVMVKPHYGLSYTEEAALFVALNKDKRKHTPFQEFFGDYEAGNPKVVAIVKLSEEFRYDILKNQAGKDRVRCYKQLRDITNERGGGIDLLREVYEQIEPWRGMKDNTKGENLRGIAHFIQKHGDNPKVLRDLKSRMRRITPEVVGALAHGKRIGNSGANGYLAVYQVILDRYNERRSSGRLEA